MDMTKLNPWNWFKKEEEEERHLPARRFRHARGLAPMEGLYAEMDRLFDDFLRQTRFGQLTGEGPGDLAGIFKPHLDLAAGEKEYAVSVELPGVDEKDVKVEFLDGLLIISGEKKAEREADEKGYYRMERSYGSFRRALAVPDDVDTANIRATFKNGVLSLALPKKADARPPAKPISITRG